MLRRMISGGVAALLVAGLAAPLHAQVDPELLAGMRARSIGPAGMSGRIADIEAVVSNPDIVYVGASTGGVWKSVNGGLAFEPIFDDQPVHAVGSVEVFEASPDIVWVGTGEGNPRNSVSGTGYGVFKSMDAGRSWAHLGLENTERIHRIALHPSDPEVAYVGAMGSMWKPNPERGLFKTEDGGATWQKILYVNESTGVGDMEMDPTNPNKLIVAMWDYRRWPWFFRSGGPGSGLYLTVDGGRNWKKLSEADGLPAGELGRIGLAIAPSDPNIVYALIEASENALYKSEDGGYTWAMINDGDNIGNRPFYYFDLRVDPQDANRVYSLWSQVSVSTDGGRSFEVLVGWGSAHPDHHAMWIDPNDPSHIYEGNDGGVYVSNDHGETWRFVSNMPLAQYYHVNVDMATPYNVYGGLQDNGSWRGPSQVWENGGIRNHHWDEVGFGDGFATLAVPGDAMVGYAMSQEGFLNRWDLRTGERKDIRPDAPEPFELRFNWNAGIAIDPFDPNTVYYGSQFVHKSADLGETWEIISPDLTTNNPEWQKQRESGGLTYDVTGAENFTTIMTIAPSPLERGVIWVGTDDGRVQVTRDGGASWESVEGRVRGVPANTWVPHIEPSKYDAGTAYVVFDNHRRGDFEPYAYVATDYGRSWRSLVTDEIWGYALVIEQDPVGEDLLFLGTEFGLYVTLNGGRDWMEWTHGFPTASAMALVVHPREHDLVIGTHGRSAYVIDDIRPLRSITAETLAQPIHLFDIPDAQQYRVKQTGASRFPGDGEFRGANRPYGALITFSLNVDGLPHPNEEIERERKAAERQPQAEEEEGEEGRAEREPQVTIEISDGDGELIRTFTAPAKLGVNRVVWDLERDAFERPGSGEEFFFFGGGGPEVVPGTYGVKVKYAEHEATGSVTVLADIRFAIPQSDREAKLAMIMHAGALQELIAEATERIGATRSEIDDVLERAAAAEDEDEEGNGDDALEELIAAGEDLKRALDDLEKRFWTPPGTTKGIAYTTDVYERLGYVRRSLGSSWDAPTPSQETYLAAVETQLRETVADFNRIFAEDVAAFRQQVESAQLDFVGDVEPLETPSR
ncbi:MAG: hypothetical protein JSV86_21010 [Gemmatimonadota bacterium]|nr:MAG: hypothetical protein JSV86_21010 [Gemmatimonadota bacterium]